MNEPTPSTAETPADPRTVPRSTLCAFVRRRGGVDVCTLYPPTVVTPDRSDAWIRATGDGFRSLEECR
ncbi:DUF7511 domain-containing protein [Natrarchaeobius oligotrophus]|uniref:DUF7511 domain-containing protein n=1 Tax=Natrarchaeobius chitinivorans TaxID=1679083 RepID=A0A3N6MD45_NATCH|nr:hypothetical protein [Natrarchaeobius chitinivorans]RQH01779.1 hypothetical protein EA472_05505 [Natrarchaeobius chitinivorans]